MGTHRGNVAMSAKHVAAYLASVAQLDAWYALHDYWTPEEETLIREQVVLFHQMRPIEQYYIDPMWRRDIRLLSQWGA